MASQSREGFLYGLVAYGWWGLIPLYFRWVNEVAAGELLAHRVVWSLAFLAVVLTPYGRWPEVVRCLRTRALVVPLTFSALFVGVNWLVYIYSTLSNRLVEAVLGYYILPLVSILLGLVLFRERLRPLQWLAVALACAGVVLLTWASGALPWIALVLAVTFSLYGAVRKRTPVDGLIGLSVETIVLAPLALGYLTLLAFTGESSLGGDAGLFARLMLSGVVTAIPLLCFGQAARRLPLSTLGFMQYVSPTIQLLVAVFLFDETVVGGWTGFYFIWAALVLFSFDSLRTHHDAHVSGGLARRAAGKPAG